MKILVAGEGGQGVQVLAQIIADVGYKQKINVSYIPHYGVEMRMGISFAYIQLSKESISYPKFSKADILAVMTKRELDISKSFIGKDTTIINAIPLTEYLKSNNLNIKSLNMLVLGILVKILGGTGLSLKIDNVKEEIKLKLGEKNDLIEKNLSAFDKGMALEKEIYTKDINILKNDEFKPIVDSDKLKTHIKFPSLCKGCGLCIEKCPVNALSWDNGKTNYISKPMPKVDINKCISCMICENICPDLAITVIKKK